MSAIDDVRGCSSDIVRSTIYIVAGRSISVHASVEVTIYFITRALPPRILSLLERRKTSHSHSHSHSHLHSHSHTQKNNLAVGERCAFFIQMQSRKVAGDGGKHSAGANHCMDGGTQIKTKKAAAAPLSLAPRSQPATALAKTAAAASSTATAPLRHQPICDQSHIRKKNTSHSQSHTYSHSHSHSHSQSCWHLHSQSQSQELHRTSQAFILHKREHEQSQNRTALALAVALALAKTTPHSHSEKLDRSPHAFILQKQSA